MTSETSEALTLHFKAVRLQDSGSVLLRKFLLRFSMQREIEVERHG